RVREDQPQRHSPPASGGFDLGTRQVEIENLRRPLGIPAAFRLFGPEHLTHEPNPHPTHTQPTPTPIPPHPTTDTHQREPRERGSRCSPQRSSKPRPTPKTSPGKPTRSAPPAAPG